MTALPPLPNSPKALPQVLGPKLAPFTRTGHAIIEFIEELGNPEQDQDARVWKIKIKGDYYALKMFKFKQTEYLRVDLGGDLVRELASPQLWADYFDPFSCECRAYGRLQEENRQDLAVRAHGYIFLTPKQEAEITKRITGIDYKPPNDHVELDGEGPWAREEEHRQLPIRAIVKDFVTHRGPFTASQVLDMWNDLEDMRELGIFVRDINIFNYIGGKLIDLSRSRAAPHPSFEYIYPHDMKSERKRDPHNLRCAILDWGIEHGWDWDQVTIPDELTKCASGQSQNDRYGTDPRLYDWRKWEKNPASANTFPEDAFLEDAPYIDPVLWPED